MVETNRPESVPAPANLAMEEFCSYELTRSNSDGDSSLTAQNSGDISHHSANARADKCVAWTDENHNKYLDFLEASFVQQLHRSRRFQAWCTEQNKNNEDSSHRLHPSISKASEQFTVLQGGQCQKKIFDKELALSYISTVKVPRTHCQRCTGKDFLVSADLKECDEFHREEENLEGKRTFSSRSASTSGQHHIKDPYYSSVIKVMDSAEGSGQNFVDEDCKYDPNASLAKRLKTAVADTSSEDQIVSSGKFFALGKSIINNTTLEGKAYNASSIKRF